jgi:hypothetical protein
MSCTVEPRLSGTSQWQMYLCSFALPELYKEQRVPKHPSVLHTHQSCTCDHWLFDTSGTWLGLVQFLGSGLSAPSSIIRNSKLSVRHPCGSPAAIKEWDSQTKGTQAHALHECTNLFMHRGAPSSPFATVTAYISQPNLIGTAHSSDQ